MYKFGTYLQNLSDMEVRLLSPSVLQAMLGRPPTEMEWRVARAIVRSLHYGAGPAYLMHTIATEYWPALRFHQIHLPQSWVVLRACQELCGPRVYLTPAHTPREALRPWTGQIRVMSVAEQQREARTQAMLRALAHATTGRVSSCM